MAATAFTEMFGIDAPIQLAPMGGVITPELIAGVIEGGGMGAFGAGPLPGPVLGEVIEAIRAKTDGPLLVNMLVPFMEPDAVNVAANLAQCVDFYHASPDAELVKEVHAAGSLAGWQVCSLADAIAAERAGCDIIVVRGVEGGGRMHGSESLWPLLAQVLDNVKIPVLAAGGIGDARGLRAALAAGAAGVRMGTRFLAAEESAAHDTYKKALLAADASDSILTDAFRVGWPDERSTSRVLRSSFDAANQFAGDVVGEMTMGGMSMPVERFGVGMPVRASTGAVEAMAMYAGESVRFVTKIEPAAEIVRTIALGSGRG